jgi:adenosylhomocysteine nucleosidase
MTSKPVTAILMATKMEAAPFIQGLNLKKTEGALLPVFQNQNTLLVISGIGKANAAMAATFCCLVYPPDIVFNLGAAGALDQTLELGEVLQVSRILEPDRPDLRTSQPMVHLPATLPDFKSVSLTTQDRPMLSPMEREQVSQFASLADMEAASVVQVCRKFETPCHVFKFVSDTRDHDRGEDIVANIRSLRNDFFDFIRTKVLSL